MRWIRGDFQISKWLKKKIRTKNGEKKNNPLGILSKYKIIDNLRRGILPILVLLAIVFSIFNNNLEIVIIATISYIFPTLLDVLNYIVFKEGKDSRFIYAHKSFIPTIKPVKASLIRSFLEFGFLPHKAYISIVAIVKTMYRMIVSKKHMLEWITSEQVEKQAKQDIFSYYKLMWVNLLFGILFLILGIFRLKTFYILLGTIWLILPIISWYISKDIKIKRPIEKVTKQDIEYLQDIGFKIWEYFKDNINKENNYLPPDNYQEDRKIKVASRTSTTNIGLGMLAIISAYDLKYIKLNETLDLLGKILNTINNLKKWNGHLYNWYNTNTLEPLIPRYISTVDNGNFVGYLYTTKQFLIELENKLVNKNEIKKMIQIIDNIINKTDFSILYDHKKHLFSIGYDVEQGRLTNSYYDLLASEARQASLVAIAKKDVSPKHWNYLSRTLTCLNKYKGLISWSGTAFEYLMPNVNIKEYEGSILDESCRFLIYSQIEYAKKLGTPFGISEAAFNLKDLSNNYQYKSFGVPWLGLKRGLEDDMVISPYSVFLSLNYIPNEAILNLKKLEKEKMCGKYGFYESIDYTVSRLKYGKKYEIVKTYMAHHLGLSLLSINNLINQNIIVNRFMRNPEIEGVSILLQERMPEKAIITKEKKEKVQKLKPKDYQNYIEKEYTNMEDSLNVTNTISNGNYTIFTKINGEGFSKFEDILINRFKETNDYKQGIFFYIKNVNSKKVWLNIPIGENEESSKIKFAPEKNEYIRVVESMETKTKIIVSPDDPVEIRRLEIKNNGKFEQTLEITNYFEPVLSIPMQDYAHMAFNNLFLTFEKDGENILVKRKKRGKEDEDIYLNTCLYTEHEIVGELEYEIDKEKFYGNNLDLIPNMVLESKPFSKNLGLVTEPCLAMKKTIKIKPNESIKLDLILCVSRKKDIANGLIEKYKNTNIITKTFDLAKAKVEAETIYLGLKGKDIEKYQKLLSYIMLNNPLKSLNIPPQRIYSQSKLWKYGISGDLKIILVKIENLNDMYVIKDMLKAHEFYLSKNIKLDLVILNMEENSYEQYLKYEIENEILNKQMEYLKNKSGGIFVINANQIEKEDIDLLEFKASFVIDAKLGDIKTQIKDLETEYIKTLKNVGEYFKNENKNNTNNNKNDLEENNKILNINMQNINIQNLKYFNEFGGFSEDGLEYTIKLEKDLKLPTVWSNILANETFGTIVTQNLGGYTWHKNSRLNRLSSWNNSTAIDIPSEIIYLKDCNSGKKWSLSNNLNNNNENNCYITYGMGYVKYKTIQNNLMHELKIFVPKKENVKINILKLENLEPNRRNLKLIYYIKPVLGEDEIITNGYIKLEKDGNIININNLYKDSFKINNAYVSSSEEINSYTGNKDFFIGKGNIKNPKGLDKIRLDNSNGLFQNSCVAIEINIELQSFESKEIVLVFGEENNILDVKNVAYKYSKVSNCLKELEEVKKYWYEKINKVQVKTPLESLNIMLNGFAKYQTIVSRLFARTSYYQSGGAIGFRDQLQDTLGLKYVDINFMKKQILICSKHQFIEGDVEHWWHEDLNRGIRTRFSDDLLWLCYVVYEYINFTNDYSILDEEEPYVMGGLLPIRSR